MKIQIYEFKKVVLEDFEIFFLEEIVYYFEIGIRRLIKIEFCWIEWNKERYDKEEEIFRLKVICVYSFGELKIEKFIIFILVFEIEGIWNLKEVLKIKSILEMIVYDWGDKRIKEQFEVDLKYVIDEVSK